MRELFNYLANREELEHSLEPDIDEPLLEGCYRATTQSRWNTPEFIADTVQYNGGARSSHRQNR